jgi:hypothetical protein
MDRRTFIGRVSSALLAAPLAAEAQQAARAARIGYLVPARKPLFFWTGACRIFGKPLCFGFQSLTADDFSIL